MSSGFLHCSQFRHLLDHSIHAMADEDAKIKSAVASLGEGCVTLIAVYIGAVVVALIITQWQRQSASNVATVTTGTPGPTAAVVPNSNDSVTAVPNAVPTVSAIEPGPDVSVSEPSPDIAPSTSVVPQPLPSASAPVGTGVLVTQDAASSVNVREAPTLSAAVQYEGHAGDSVTILDQATNNEGTLWYYVRFLNSDVVGWIHSNYLQITTPGTESYASPNPGVPSPYSPLVPSSL